MTNFSTSPFWLSTKDPATTITSSTPHTNNTNYSDGILDLMYSYTRCNDVSCRVNNDYMNRSHDAETLHDVTGRDASWILTSAVIILGMQTGRKHAYNLPQMLHVGYSISAILLLYTCTMTSFYLVLQSLLPSAVFFL